MRVVFVAGAGRSGSTLLARLAGQCEEVAAVGELRHLHRSGALVGDPTQRCTCGETLDVCPFWTAIAQGVRARGRDPERFEQLRSSVDRIRHILQIRLSRQPSAFAKRRDEFLLYLRDIYELLLEQEGASVVIDSSKDPSFLFLALEIPEIEVEVVHLVRDPRAVAYSWTTRKVQPEIVTDEVYMPTYRVSRSAAFWAATNLLAELASRRAKRYHRLRYEDFTRDPSGSVTRALDSEANSLPFVDGSVAEFSQSEHHVGGNPDRFQTGRVVISEDERWKSRLRWSQRLMVTALCFPLMVRYGYRVWTGSDGKR